MSNDPNTPASAANETTVMTVWPTIGATSAGRLVGRLAANDTGLDKFFTLGKLMALATIPISLGVFFWQLAPGVIRRYRLTNRRILVQKGLRFAEETGIGLDEFDTIDVEVLPGQAWLRSGDLVFRREGNEALRLPGVPHPEPFRHVCLKAQTAVLSVRKVLQEQAATPQPA